MYKFVEAMKIGAAGTLPPEYAALPRTDYPGSTITPGLIDCHVHLGFDGGPHPVARMRAETDAQQLVLDAAQRQGFAWRGRDHRPRPRGPGLP